MSKLSLGIIGGGQLGSMLAQAAKHLDIKTIIFCDDINAPAQNFCDEFIFGSYNNEKDIKKLLKKSNIITFEFENIPYETLNMINNVKKVIPKPSINRIIQHRLAEKDFINNLNIRTTRYIHINKKSDLNTVESFLPGILKTTTLGYDGKGQHPIKSLDDLDKLKIDFSKDYILEKFVKLKQEISVLITRFDQDEYEIYEPIENVHENQILKFSSTPANIKKNINDLSKEWAIKIAEKLNYIGTMCVEFFIDWNDNLYVNEIAPRVHNSGHLTINAYNVSQFENHIRAVCNLEKIPIKKISDAKMMNILGDQILFFRNKKNFESNEFFFDYLKKDIKDKRKMGHLTTLI